MAAAPQSTKGTTRHPFDVVVGGIRVMGRLAWIIVYLVGHQKELGVDECDEGHLHVTWGSGEIRGWVERWLPKQGEPGRT